MLKPLRRMETQLRSRHYPGLSLDVDVVEGENHSTVDPLGITRGLVRLFGTPEQGR